jgi:hypothetical protein
MRSPDWLRWQEVMVEERMVLEMFGTWRLEKPPPNANIISVLKSGFFNF